MDQNEIDIIGAHLARMATPAIEAEQAALHDKLIAKMQEIERSITPDPRLTALQAENEKLREALRAIEEGRIARPVGSSYRADGVPSKHDLCVHNVYMYQACESCIDAHIEAALEPK